MNRSLRFGVGLALAWFGMSLAWSQSVYLNLTSPLTQVLGGQSVLYNLAYGNTAVPVTTMDTFEADTAGGAPSGWATVSGSSGYVINQTVITGLNGPTGSGNQAVSAVYNNGCGPFCGHLNDTAVGPVTNGSIQADFYLPNSGNAAALMWRNDISSNNHYQMGISQGGNPDLWIGVENNTSFTNLALAFVTVNAGEWHTFKLAVSGAGPVTLTAFVDGAQVASASTTVSLAPGLPGIQVQGNSKLVFDNVQVTQSPDADSVSLLDPLPSGLSYSSSSVTPAAISPSVGWYLGNVIAGQGATIQLIATTNGCGNSLVNQASLTIQAPASAVTSLAVTVQALCSPTPTPPAPGNNPYVYSNPSSGPTVQFVYNMAESGKADIRVWNASGVLAASLEDAKASGIQQSVLNIQSFAPGHYFYQIDLKYDSGREDRFKTQVLAVQK